jgi:3-hydroxyisobutyrate dehydrogenase-like beta-hydroxyacid dehydrogenase
MKSPAVGVIGLGIMGSAIAANLARAGFPVHGYDVVAARSRALRRAGGTAERSAAEVAVRAPVIITSLPNSEALLQISTVLKRSGAIVVETSTLPIEEKLKAFSILKRQGIALLDCPLSGTGAQAKIRDLVVLGSGERKAFEKTVPVLQGFARSHYYLGAFGNGSRMKYVANLLVAINNVASAEAMVLGMKAGLDPQTIFDMISNGAGNSRVFELRAPMMVKNRYDQATMKCSVWQKDMDVIGAFAKRLKVPTPLFSATVPVYAAALKGGHAEDDTAAVCAVLEAKAGVKRRKRR